LCCFSWVKNLVLNRAAPTTWGVFTPAFCVPVKSFIPKADRVNAGRVVFVCYVGGAGVGVENDFIPCIDSGSSAGTNTRKFCSHKFFHGSSFHYFYAFTITGGVILYHNVSGGFGGAGAQLAIGAGGFLSGFLTGGTNRLTGLAVVANGNPEGSHSV
jgi:hypothetical protein